MNNQDKLMDADDVVSLTKARAVEIGERVRKFTSASAFDLTLECTAKTVTRIANGRVLINDDGVLHGHNVWVRVDGQYEPSSILSLDDEGIRKAVAYAERKAKVVQGRLGGGYRMATRRLPVPEVPIWKPATISAMTGAGAQAVRSTALPAMLDVVSRTPFVAAGVLGFFARALYNMRSDGPEAYYRETDVVCSVSARAKDGSSSGWSGVASRDWATIDAPAVAHRAVAIAERAVNPVALEPGRRTVILSATACGQLISALSMMFDAFSTNTGNTPFSGDHGGNKLGQRVADERVRLWSDPADPMGGYVPFWGDMRDGMDVLRGAPVPAMTWIERGVLMNLAYGYKYSLDEGKPWNRMPHSLHLDGEPGVARATVDEMIVDCKEGIFVNRFSPIMPVHPRSGLVTGVTRDGCFLIKNGKILKPIKNLRFLDSPVFALNKLVAMGTPERVVTDDSVSGAASFPIIAPPIMVRDFNFNALSDAV